jgi:hypothetical protein
VNGHLILAAAATAVVYAVWAYFHPFRDCPRCKGSGRNRLSTKRRRGRCWRCKGTREIRTLGARMLHRAVRSARSSWRGRKEK